MVLPDIYQSGFARCKLNGALANRRFYPSGENRHYSKRCV
jgi:hypothetical protein